MHTKQELKIDFFCKKLVAIHRTQEPSQMNVDNAFSISATLIWTPMLDKLGLIHPVLV